MLTAWKVLCTKDIEINYRMPGDLSRNSIFNLNISLLLLHNILVFHAQHLVPISQHSYFLSDIGDPRQARKRNRSQQSRSRNSSRENKKSPNTKLDQPKLRSRSVSCISPSDESHQPEYINIASLKSSAYNSSENTELDLSWSSKILPSNTIGPDDWYRDDFDFDKSHPFLDDPMLLKQYAQILDMKYRDSSNEKIEEILIQNSLAQQVDLEAELEAGRTGFSAGRGYPDSGYDTLRVDLTGAGEKNQLCVDIDLENSLRFEAIKMWMISFTFFVS